MCVNYVRSFYIYEGEYTMRLRYVFKINMPVNEKNVMCMHCTKQHAYVQYIYIIPPCASHRRGVVELLMLLLRHHLLAILAQHQLLHHWMIRLIYTVCIIALV